MATPTTSTSSTSGNQSARGDTSESRVPEDNAAMVVLANFNEQSAGIEAALPTEDSNSASRLKFLFVMAAVQTTSVVILADSGSPRNLMSEKLFRDCRSSLRYDQLVTFKSWEAVEIYLICEDS